MRRAIVPVIYIRGSGLCPSVTGVGELPSNDDHLPGPGREEIGEPLKTPAHERHREIGANGLLKFESVVGQR